MSGLNDEGSDMRSSVNKEAASPKEEGWKGCPVILLGGNALYRRALQSVLGSQVRLRGENSFFFSGFSTADEIQANLGDLSDLQRQSVIILFFDEGHEFSFLLRNIKHVESIFSSPKIVLISDNRNKSYIYRCIECGVCAYILPDLSEDHLIDCIKVVASGQMVFPSHIYAFDIENRRPRSEPGSNIERVMAAPWINEKEAKILACLASGLSNKEISRLMELSDPATKLAVRKLLTKIGAKNRVQGAVWAKQNGYAFEVQPA